MSRSAMAPVIVVTVNAFIVPDVNAFISLRLVAAMEVFLKITFSVVPDA